MPDPLPVRRLPRAFDQALGAESRAAVGDLSADHASLVEGAGGSSPYLKTLIEREAEWLPQALNDPQGAMSRLISAATDLPPDQMKKGLRVAKRRVALLTALADLSGAWPLERITGILTDFAGLACDLALKSEIAALIRRRRLPGQTGEDIDGTGGLAVLAMGKMGAHELNYSSDIDLICLFDETRYDQADFHDARTGLVRATRNMVGLLSEKTADGYVFRTDLRLRPDPAVTPVCMAMEAAERYYESLGRTWERAAFIKARAAAGDIAAGERFLETLKPFVWRRHLDFAAIQDAHDMRLRIRETKGTGGPLSVPGHDMKLGRGGIREIEFFTQTRQLIAGGRDPGLRQRGTVAGLAALADRGWIPEDVAAALTAHYRAHREVEHRIQMVHDAQTHKVPSSDDGLGRVACLMGMETEALMENLQHRLTEVHDLTEGFFAPGAGPAPAVEKPSLTELDDNVVSRWTTYPALRSQRAARIFDRLKPVLLSRISRAARPDEALLALDGFLAGLPAGVQVFSLLEANPQLVDLLVDIAGTSSELAGFLSRNSGVFDAVIGGGFFSDWPGEQALQKDLAACMAGEDDYERQLDAARRWTKEWHFRIGVHHLRDIIDGKTAGTQYADLASAVIAALLPVVETQFSRRHGPPPGRGLTVLGMGSLGARRLNAKSDLDLIVIYDPAGDDTSDGPRPLATRPYFARLTQALITALTAPMSQGKLYEVDMRLRPSGTQGPVATSWASFSNYQKSEAWTWEHLALTRARPVVGPPDLMADVESFRRDILSTSRNRAQVLAEVAKMRARIEAAKTPDGVWDAKVGAGRLQDIELIAQSGALLSGTSGREVSEGLKGAVVSGIVSDSEAQELQRGHSLMWAVHAATRLVSGQTMDTGRMGEGGAAFLCRTTGYDDIAGLQADLEKAYDDSARIVEAALPDAVGGES